jgi:8-oxo-dGTP pyrophosphatase MutT (NUDIX family)
MKEYCLGFLFDNDLSKIVLIRKLKPIWQYNLLNGVGGSIERGETPIVAMDREFREETTYAGEDIDWKYFALLNGGEFKVSCFAAKSDNVDLKARTAEAIEVCDIDKLEYLRKQMIENLPWLINLAVDHLQDGRPIFADIKYE